MLMGCSDTRDRGHDAATDTTPVDTTPVDTTPVDTTPVDTTPVDTTPVDTVDATLPADCTPQTRTETLLDIKLTVKTIDPRCTDAAITNCTLDGVCLKEQKDHLIIVPETVTRPELWVHLAGSGGKPTNATNVTRAAAVAGYRSIGVAYMNEPSVNDRCTDRASGNFYGDDCPERTRLEVIYGEDKSPWIQIGVPDSVVSRLEHLLAWLVVTEPAGGWGDYLDDDGHPRWNRIGWSGFSQGGGNVGLIARDHAVFRTMFLSKGAGTVPRIGDACVSVSTCPENTRCCGLDDPDCEVEPPVGGGRCVGADPAPWVFTGAGGVGTAADRATPATREYGIVNTHEAAWFNSPTVFAAWGMDAFGAFVSADPGDETPPYGGTHMLSSSLDPCGTGSYHQSMGADAIQPKIGGCGGNRPAMFDAWIYMMTHVDPR